MKFTTHALERVVQYVQSQSKKVNIKDIMPSKIALTIDLNSRVIRYKEDSFNVTSSAFPGFFVVKKDDVYGWLVITYVSDIRIQERQDAYKEIA